MSSHSGYFVRSVRLHKKPSPSSQCVLRGRGELSRGPTIPSGIQQRGERPEVFKRTGRVDRAQALASLGRVVSMEQGGAASVGQVSLLLLTLAACSGSSPTGSDVPGEGDSNRAGQAVGQAADGADETNSGGTCGIQGSDFDTLEQMAEMCCKYSGALLTEAFVQCVDKFKFPEGSPLEEEIWEKRLSNPSQGPESLYRYLCTNAPWGKVNWRYGSMESTPKTRYRGRYMVPVNGCGAPWD